MIKENVAEEKSHYKILPIALVHGFIICMASMDTVKAVEHIP
jgi:hypothetical protein